MECDCWMKERFVITGRKQLRGDPKTQATDQHKNA